MNVLLAEADVPYEQLKEMDDINPEFPRTDVSLVIGANDVTNPPRRTTPASPIYGMPILDVESSHSVIVIKRSMNPGFAGIENELYYKPADRDAVRRRQERRVGHHVRAREHLEAVLAGGSGFARPTAARGTGESPIEGIGVRRPCDPLRSAGASPGAAGARRAVCEDGSVIAREQALAALAAESFDVVVVGGGITGAGVALDAASRGYSVALIERADYASGTSSRSSKLVHGGLRYLQQFDLGLVREALLERQLMVMLAPHLVLPLPIIVAATGGARLDRLVGVGLNLYDVMSVERRRGRRGAGDAWSPDRHRTISGEEVVELLPALARGRADRRLPLLRLPDRRRRGWC